MLETVFKILVRGSLSEEYAIIRSQEENWVMKLKL
jgi:hypothetical protein